MGRKRVQTSLGMPRPERWERSPSEGTSSQLTNPVNTSRPNTVWYDDNSNTPCSTQDRRRKCYGQSHIEPLPGSEKIERPMSCLDWLMGRLPLPQAASAACSPSGVSRAPRGSRQTARPYVSLYRMINIVPFGARTFENIANVEPDTWFE